MVRLLDEDIYYILLLMLNYYQFYYIFEVIPKNENYAMRLFLDNNKVPLEYYFDICKNNGLDDAALVLFYDNLYLLIITYLTKRRI